MRPVRLWGRRRASPNVPPGSEVPLLPLVAAMLSAWETFEVFIDMGDLPAQFGVELTPLPVVMQRMYGNQSTHP